MRKIAICAVCVLVLLLGAGAAALKFLDSGFMARKIAEASREALGAPITFGANPSLGLFPLSLSFEGLSLDLPMGAWHAGMRAKSGHVNIAFAPLLSGRLEISELALDKPDISISGSGFPGPAGSRSRPAASQNFQLRKLVARDGSASIDCDSLKARLSQVNLSIENLQPRQEADLKCDFALDLLSFGGAQAAGGKIDGNLALSAKVRYYAPNIIFRQASAAFTNAAADSESWPPSFRLSFEGALDPASGQVNVNSANLNLPALLIEFNGEGDWRQPRFSGRASLDLDLEKLLGESRDASKKRPPLIVAGRVSCAGHSLLVDDAALALGNAKGSGHAYLDLPADGRPMKISGRLSLGSLPLESLIPTWPAQKSPAGKSGGEAPDIDFHVEIGETVWGKLLFSKTSFHLSGASGAYSLDDFKCGWAGGQIEGSIKGGPGTPASLAMRGSGINMGQALGQLGIPDIKGGSGRFDIGLDAPAANLEAIQTGLAGSGKIEASGLEIGVFGELAWLLPTLKKGEKGFGKGVSASVDFRASQGEVDFQPISLASRLLDARGRARASLAGSRLDGQLTLKAFGLTIPLTFQGPFGDVHLGLGGKEAEKKSLP